MPHIRIPCRPCANEMLIFLCMTPITVKRSVRQAENPMKYITYLKGFLLVRRSTHAIVAKCVFALFAWHEIGVDEKRSWSLVCTNHSTAFRQWVARLVISNSHRNKPLCRNAQTRNFWETSQHKAWMDYSWQSERWNSTDRSGTAFVSLRNGANIVLMCITHLCRNYWIGSTKLIRTQR